MLTSQYLAFLILVFVTITAALVQDDTADLTENTDCESQLTVCETELHELRKQRERTIAAFRKKVFRFRFPHLEEQRLRNEITVLEHQLYHPNDSTPDVSLSYYFSGVGICCSDVAVMGTNCTENLEICQSNKTTERKRIADYEGHTATHIRLTEEKKRSNILLRETAAKLRAELAARNMTAHPNANFTPEFDENWRDKSSSEYDVDSAEFERRVAASIVTRAPTTTN